MQITQRFRRAVQPLNITTSLEVMSDSDHSPSLQTTDGSDFKPDRSKYPTVLRIRLSATSADGTAAYDITSSVVTNIQWWVQGAGDTSPVKIESHSAWTATTDYVVDNNTAKGQITIKKNITAAARYVIYATFDIVDTRRGTAVTIPCQTDTVLLHTIADAEDQYTMAFDRATAETYDPVLDKSLLHDWKTAHGYESTYEDDGNSHLRTLNVTLRNGSEKLTAGTDWTLKVYKVAADGTETKATAETDDGIASIDGGTVVFDYLFAQQATYCLSAEVGGKEVYRKSYGWMWADAAPTIPLGGGVIAGATYADGSTQACKTQLDMSGNAIEHPECAMTLDWYARKGTVDTFRGSGESMVFDLTDSAMFASGSAEGQAVCEVNRRGAAQYATDESGDYLTDADGDKYVYWA